MRMPCGSHARTTSAARYAAVAPALPPLRISVLADESPSLPHNQLSTASRLGRPRIQTGDPSGAARGAVAFELKDAPSQ